MDVYSRDQKLSELGSYPLCLSDFPDADYTSSFNLEIIDLFDPEFQGLNSDHIKGESKGWAEPIDDENLNNDQPSTKQANNEAFIQSQSFIDDEENFDFLVVNKLKVEPEEHSYSMVKGEVSLDDGDNTYNNDDNDASYTGIQQRQLNNESPVFTDDNERNIYSKNCSDEYGHLSSTFMDCIENSKNNNDTTMNLKGQKRKLNADNKKYILSNQKRNCYSNFNSYNEDEGELKNEFNINEIDQKELLLSINSIKTEYSDPFNSVNSLSSSPVPMSNHQPTTRLPLTPPLSHNSDSECSVGGVSNPPSPKMSSKHQASGMGSTVLRDQRHQPFFSSPISNNGILVLSEEEKRTLLAEGYSLPSKLPLSKQEEKNLKKIRRKIKNKISAQESRRKKKEYLESLEKKVEVVTQENTSLKKRINMLENNNRSLITEVQKLQSIVSKVIKTPSSSSSSAASSSLSSPVYFPSSSAF